VVIVVVLSAAVEVVVDVAADGVSSPQPASVTVATRMGTQSLNTSQKVRRTRRCPPPN
jgi:hypothetical protein